MEEREREKKPSSVKNERRQMNTITTKNERTEQNNNNNIIKTTKYLKTNIYNVQALAVSVMHVYKTSNYTVLNVQSL